MRPALTSVGDQPFYTYDHSTGSAVIGGPFYTGTAYPPQYRDNFFFGDYSGNFIKRVVFDDHAPAGLGAAVRRPTSQRPVVADRRAPTG